jgi:hypothetical protein
LRAFVRPKTNQEGQGPAQGVGLQRKEVGEAMKKNTKKKSRCWKGYKPVKGKKPYAKGSCKKK